MTNKAIAKIFSELAKLMEVHEESPSKVRTYQNAYVAIRNQAQALIKLNEAELLRLSGFGKTLTTHILQLQEDGALPLLQEYRLQTPEGVLDMLQIRGLGAKKIKLLWKDYGIDDLAKLLNACRENRLIQIKGFGPKMQSTIEEGISFFLASKGKMLMSKAHSVASRLMEDLAAFDIPLFPMGDVLTNELEVESIQFATVVEAVELEESGVFSSIQILEDHLVAETEEGIPVFIYTEVDEAGALSLDKSKVQYPDVEVLEENEEYGPTFSVPPFLWWKNGGTLPKEEDLIELTDIKGVIHNHSTYSDGAHSILEMAQAAQNLGYKYLVMSDHSKSAFYANGLTEERVLQQWKEIDHINTRLTDFRVFKSIESDILSDGQLDYDDAFLSGFDLVIASVHAHLNMDEQRATQRLIKAIEHPATKILGHPTGRLLLGRAGYPIHHQRVIDACAANQVSIELNANPYRLDLDYRWIEYAMEKDVMVAINPDAHHVDGIEDIAFGVMAARKGGLLKSACLNTLDVDQFTQWIQ